MIIFYRYWPKLFLRLAPYLRNSVTPTQPSLVLPIVDVQRLMLSFEQLFLNKRTQRYTEMKLTEQEVTHIVIFSLIYICHPI